MSEFVRDLRFGVRLLKKSPVFTAAATLLLAIGISANTLIFSLVNALLLSPLPVVHPENLVRVVEVHPTDFVTWNLPYSFCDGAGPIDRDFSEVICQGEADVAFNDGHSTERVRVHFVSPNFFSSLGVEPYLGRVLTSEDERTRTMNAVLSYEFWRKRWHGDAAVVGRRMLLGGYSFTIVGVAPEGFNGLSVDTSPDIRVPAAVDRYLVKPSGEMSPNARPLAGQMFARLREGVPFERADAEADRLLATAYKEEEGRIYPEIGQATRSNTAIESRLRLERVANGVSTLRAQFSRGLEVLMGGVALLLLMACANVAGLLLARSTARSQEMGIRLALGASPGRIVRQLLTEGLLLALVGGAGGIALSAALSPLLVRALPPIRDRATVLQPLAVHVSIDYRVLAFGLGLSILTAVLFALSPALHSARVELADTLRGARTATRRLRMRNLFVTGQVAICTLLLLGAALLVGTLERMRSMGAGFNADGVLSFTIDPELVGRTPEQSRMLSKRVLDTVRALPGVQAVGMAARPVMRGSGVKATFGAAGARIHANDFLNSSLNDVTPGYFATMGIQLIAGRPFHWFDHAEGTPQRVIVNQTFARRFFPDRNPIGARFGLPGPGGIAKDDDEIIGVVSDAKYRSLREPIPPTVYGPASDGLDSTFTLYVRTGQERPEGMMTPIREALRSVDPEIPLVETHTLRAEVEASLWQERLLALLSSLFGAIAATLAAVGLYGATDYAVKSRTREIGIRVALGAQPAGIAGVFSREAFLMTAAGMGLGLCGYAAAAVWIRGVVYGARLWEPSVVVVVVVLVGVIGVLATVPAAYRALRIDPVTALRAE